VLKISYKLSKQDALRIKEAYHHVSETFVNFNFDFMLADLANAPNISARVNDTIIFAKLKNLKVCYPWLEMVLDKRNKRDCILLTTNRADYLLSRNTVTFKEGFKKPFAKAFLKMTLLAATRESLKFVAFIDFGSKEYPYFFNFSIGGENKTDGSFKRLLTYFSEFDDALRLSFYREIKKTSTTLQQTCGKYFYENIKKLFSIKLTNLNKIEAFDFTKVKNLSFLPDNLNFKTKAKYSLLVYSCPEKELCPEEIFFDIDAKNVLTLYCLSKKIADVELEKMATDNYYPDLWFKTLYREYLYGKAILTKFPSETLLQL
jgi:hypothetical protein